jgi:O-antigen/teichoic acid export membrane protein
LSEERFRISGTLREIAENTGWLFGLRMLRMLFAFFVTAWVARYLGTARFGILQYAVAFVGLFMPLAILGLQTIVVRDIVREPDARDEILGTTLALRFAGGIAGFAIAAAAIWIIRPGDPLVRLVTAVTGLTLIFHTSDTFDLWFQSQVQSKYMVIAKSVSLAVAALLRIGAILTEAPLVVFAAILSVDIAIAGAGLYIAYRQRGLRVSRWRFSTARAGQLLSQSWMLILTGALSMIYFKIDQVMLGQMAGDDEVGVYGAAVRLSEVWYFIPLAIATSVFPALIRAKERGERIYYARLQQLYDFLAGLGLLLAVFFTLAADRVILIVFGSDYAAAGPILAVHIWAGVFIFLKVALNRWQLNEGYLKFLFWSSALGAAVNVGLNIFLIPRYGGMGAAIATVVSYGLAGTFCCFLYRPAWRNGWMMLKALLIPFRALGRLAGRRSRDD